MNLVIVESPTKAKTISKFLGRGYTVKSSYGHLRDLPKGKLGIDVKNDFKPTYVTEMKNKKIIKELKEAASDSQTVYFATDEDREGEAIAWHLLQILKTPSEKTRRIAFHEITREAILESLKNPRDINENLVNAQQARRILDRIVGYLLSPFLWRKVAKGLSAGRVQSAALRLIVEREKEILNFQRQEYWTIEGLFKTTAGDEINAKLIKFNDKELEKFDVKTGVEAKKITAKLEGETFAVNRITKKEVRRLPQPPFTTSSLQQEANHVLGFSAKQTMKIAQNLYEGVELGDEGSVGLITYMRTDSVQLALKFQNAARQLLEQRFGKEFVPGVPRVYKTKSRLAQEAHEAIRPTEANRYPEEIKNYLTPDQFKLYSLIWRRALSSQMSDALLDTTTLDIAGADGANIFRANGSVLKFPGFLRLYEIQTKETLLPELAQGQKLETKEVLPKQHFTEPPARFNDATLVKALEQHGIGRPSTYAPTISTLLERNYVSRPEPRILAPTDIGMLVSDMLLTHFPEIVNYEFTAGMEERLDEIAHGQKEWVPVIQEFYDPFSQQLSKKEKEVTKKVAAEVTKEVCKNCGKPMIVRMSRYGKFLACSGFPECRYTAKINKEATDGEVEASKSSGQTKPCSKCDGLMEEKLGRFGAYFKCIKCGATETKIVKTGASCPDCGKGELVERKTAKRRTFYSCDRYPDCKFALWNKPTGEKCLQCGSLLVSTPKGQVKCSSKECGYKHET